MPKKNIEDDFDLDTAFDFGDDKIVRLLKILQEKDNRKIALIREAWENTPPDKRTPMWLDTLLASAGIGTNKRFLAIAAVFGEEEAKKLYPFAREKEDLMPGGVKMSTFDASLDFKIDKALSDYLTMFKIKAFKKLFSDEDEEEKKPKTKKVLIPVKDKDGNIQFMPMEVDGDTDTTMLMFMTMLMMNNNSGNNRYMEEISKMREQMYQLQLEQIKRESELREKLLKEKLDPILKQAMKTPKDFLNEIKEYVNLAKEMGMLGETPEEAERRERREMFEKGMETLKLAIQEAITPLSKAIGEGLKEGIVRQMEIKALREQLKSGGGGKSGKKTKVGTGRPNDKNADKSLS